MSLLRANVVSNLVASGWSALLNLACVPVYVHLLGMESYGLIGMFAALQAALGLLDLGISPALSRELARYSAEAAESRNARDLARTVEVLYWVTGALIGIAVASAAGLIATRWVHASALPVVTVVRAIVLMGLVAAAQWPITLYMSGLQGLQRQVLLSILTAVLATFRYGGAALVVAYASPTITAFFLWQMAVSLCGSAILGVAFWRCMPTDRSRPRVRWALLRTVRRFAAGVTGIAILSLLLTQADKVILSKVLTLADFGYYSLAVLISQSLVLFSGPVVRAVFPRFSQLVVVRDEPALRSLYHRAAQTVALGAIPAGLLLVLFSTEVLTLWTRSVSTAAQAHLSVSLLVLGSIFLALQTVPYFLALAHGYTQLNIRMGLATVCITIPLLVLAARRYGGPGAAAVWLLVNGGTTPIYLYFVHRRFLGGELRTWWTHDVLLPAAASLAPLLLTRALLPSDMDRIPLLTCLGLTYMAACSLTVLLSPELRHMLRGYRARLARPLPA